MKQEIDVTIKLGVEKKDEWILVYLGEINDTYNLSRSGTNELGRIMIVRLSEIRGFEKAKEIFRNNRKEATKYVDEKLKELGLIKKVEMKTIK